MARNDSGLYALLLKSPANITIRFSEEFTKRVTEEIALNYERESEYRFMVDARD